MAMILPPFSVRQTRSTTPCSFCRTHVDASRSSAAPSCPGSPATAGSAAICATFPMTTSAPARRVPTKGRPSESRYE